ncbi:MAG: reverse gyrase [Desulfurococcaceae archaeon]
MVETRELGIYRYGCVNCGGEIDDYRLIYKAPCSNCLPQQTFSELLRKVKENIGNYNEIVKIYREAVVDKKGIEDIYNEIVEVENFEKFFEKATRGFKPWSSQLTWAKRLFRKKSFSIVAPTGTGKTVFALIYSLYIVSKNPSIRVIIVFPTRILLQQAYSKIRIFAENADLKICEESSNTDCIVIIPTLLMNAKNRRVELMKSVEEGRFNILLTTSKFMHKHKDKLIGKTYELIVLDDVDAILKSSKAITTLFQILGLTEEEINEAVKYIVEFRKSRFEKTPEIKEYEEAISKMKEKIKTTVLVSSATGRPRGIYPKLFKLLLGFEVGTKSEAIRNIIDCYIQPKKSLENTLIELIKLLGGGGLIYVPVDMGIDYADKIKDLLKQSGVKAESFYSGKSLKIVEQFARGELDILVGVATYYGVMVRGLDLPERVKYTVFIGVPRHKFSAKLESPSSLDVVRVMSILVNVLEGDEKRSVETLYGKLISRFRRMSVGAIRLIDEKFRKKLSSEAIEEDYMVQLLEEALKTARELLARSDIWNRLSTSGEIGIVREGDKEYLLVPDVATYIQASGRCSRLYPGGVTKGLSIVIVDDIRLLNGLKRKIRYIYEDVDFKEIDLDKESDVENIQEIMKEISSERDHVKKIISGEISVEKKLELTTSALLIVESPNKAKTIASFFGKPSVRVLRNGLLVYDTSTGKYTLSIVATMGHIYDLTVDAGWDDQGVKVEAGSFIPIYTDIKICNNCGYQFKQETTKCPRCDSPFISRRKDVVDALRDLAKEVDLVLIGTDPDTEGEKIGWDIKVLLEPYAKEIKRIEFHEVTRRAILDSLNNPRDFKLPLVKAQIVRRVEDRWLGFTLSRILQEVLWSKYCYKLHQSVMTKLFKEMIRSLRQQGTRYINWELKKPETEKKLADCCAPMRNLSAGRVQTPVLGFIIDKFNESRNKYNWKAIVEFRVENENERIVIPLNKLLDKFGSNALSEVRNRKVNVRRKEVFEIEINPPPPYTTDTLLEDASQKLNLSVMRTMEIAQDLFEAGLITYHRTDSTRVSDYGIGIARIYLEQAFGEKYEELFKPRSYGEGGAHECIRITRPVDPDRLRELVREGLIYVPKPLSKQHFDVYELIFKRFIASQMKPARVVVEKYVATIEDIEFEFSRYTKIVDPGFLLVYRDYIQIKDSISEGEYDVVNVHVTKPPLARYHDVINWMKTQKIGRPSTYAKIVQTLIDRRYVKVVGKGAEKALVPTLRGLVIYGELKKLYPRVIDVDKTRELENKMERVERGESDHQEVLNEIYREVLEELKYERVMKFEEEYAKEIRELLCGEERGF